MHRRHTGVKASFQRFAVMDQVKTTLAVVGAASVATALLVLAKRTLESRRNVDAERRCVRLQAYPLTPLHFPHTRHARLRAPL